MASAATTEDRLKTENLELRPKVAHLVIAIERNHTDSVRERRTLAERTAEMDFFKASHKHVMEHGECLFVAELSKKNEEILRLESQARQTAEKHAQDLGAALHKLDECEEELVTQRQSEGNAPSHATWGQHIIKLEIEIAKLKEKLAIQSFDM